MEFSDQPHQQAPGDDDDDFNSLHKAMTDALVATTRTTSRLCSEDVAYHRSLDRSVAVALDRQHGRLLSLAQRLLANAAAGTDIAAPRLPDPDAVDANWTAVVDVLDSLLERADTSLDEFAGARRSSPAVGAGKEDAAVAGATTTTTASLGSKQHRLRLQQQQQQNHYNHSGRVPRNLDIPKPQKTFEHPPDNHNTNAFKPLLTSKPHAIVLLEKSLGGTTTSVNGYAQQQFDHPYKTEIEQYEYPASVYTQADPIPYDPFESTTATFVDTPEALDAMLEELKTASEIAVDLEHHDGRTYIGLVSLMQISTRNRDWIVDTLKPWRRRLERLNEVFADPKVLKVFHGATSDIIWLQRDFGVYIVGLFDTYHASKVLRYTAGSLAFLLEKFVHFKAQKQFQLADWRIRPIPPEMLDYARSDTHFLLRIYDHMRNELIISSDFSKPDQDLIQRVLDLSKETDLQRYENPLYDEVHGMGPQGWYRPLSRTPALFSREQFSVFRAVHRWRDQVARDEDDSINWVMNNHSLFSIAREMPADRVAMFSTAAPISQPVRLRIDELVGIVARAKVEGENGPEMVQVMGEVENIILSTRKDRYGLPKTSAAIKSSNSSSTDPTVPNITIASTPLPGVVTEALPQSKFWGSAFVSSFWQIQEQQQRQLQSSLQKKANDTEEMRLQLPLPALTAEVFADGPNEVDDSITNTANELQKRQRQHHDYVKAEDRSLEDGQDDVFVVKQLGGKRKRRHDKQESLDATVASDDDDDDDGSTANSTREEARRIEEDKARRKAERKAAKKEAKRLAASASGNGSRAEGGMEEAETQGSRLGNAAGDKVDGQADSVEMFDYANAPSVLHGTRDEAEMKKKGKMFDIYSKAMDTTKGLGRINRERAGKSRTFK